MDWLSRLLDLTPVRGHLDVRCSLGSPWRIDHTEAMPGEIPYHIVLAGTAWLDDPRGGPAQRLQPGDILLLPSGDAHVLHDGGGERPLPIREHVRGPVQWHENGGEPTMELLCGRFLLTPPHDRLLREHLARRLIVRTAEPGGVAPSQDALTGLVELLRHEAADQRLGGRAMLDALTTALFALALRAAGESTMATEGWLAIAAEPRLQPALDALLHAPEQDWTLPALAERCHMSRATLARHFQQIFGRSPADLLMAIRMNLAAEALRRSDDSIAAIGESVGYQSDAAFQRVFKRMMGVTPAQWRHTSPRPITD